MLASACSPVSRAGEEEADGEDCEHPPPSPSHRCQATAAEEGGDGGDHAPISNSTVTATTDPAGNVVDMGNDNNASSAITSNSQSNCDSNCDSQSISSATNPINHQQQQQQQQQEAQTVVSTPPTSSSSPNPSSATTPPRTNAGQCAAGEVGEGWDRQDGERERGCGQGGGWPVGSVEGLMEAFPLSGMTSASFEGVFSPTQVRFCVVRFRFRFVLCLFSSCVCFHFVCRYRCLRVNFWEYLNMASVSCFVIHVSMVCVCVCLKENCIRCWLYVP